MAACGIESNAISLDAFEIANLIFSDEAIETQYKESLLFNLKSLDLKTYFEMLVIVATEGMKLNYAGSDNLVDISNLTQDNIDYINTFLKKLNVKMIVEVISLIEWNFDESKRKKSYKELLVNTKTKLSELYFILEKGNYLAISFEKL